jgi:mono/diheme cytochrome c family protein
MTRLCVLTMAVCAEAVVGSAATPSVTFQKDVLPILQKNCQTCHRPGEVAPFSLMSYAEARPWAKAIKVAVVSQQMPPWFADPKVGHFSNERRLSEEQIATLVSWANNGAPEGDPKDAPAPLKFVDGWNIKPDLEIEMPAEFQVPCW